MADTMSYADRHADMCLGCANERDPYRVRKSTPGPDEGYVPDFAEELED